MKLQVRRALPSAVIVKHNIYLFGHSSLQIFSVCAKTPCFAVFTGYRTVVALVVLAAATAVRVSWWQTVSTKLARHVSWLSLFILVFTNFIAFVRFNVAFTVMGSSIYSGLYSSIHSSIYSSIHSSIYNGTIYLCIVVFLQVRSSFLIILYLKRCGIQVEQ